jgi:hypothetical protein
MDEFRKRTRELRLNRTTLRELGARRASRVRGGQDPIINDCTIMEDFSCPTNFEPTCPQPTDYHSCGCPSQTQDTCGNTCPPTCHGSECTLSVFPVTVC